MIYFDNSATTHLNQEVLDSMLPFMTEFYGNPSSTYKLGQQSRFAIDNARRLISDYIHSTAQEIIFTSGGTESINLAIKGIAEAFALESGKFDSGHVHLITSSIEHSAILSTFKHMNSIGYQVHVIDVEMNGHLKIDDLKNVLEDIVKAGDKNILATFQYANSEIGSIQDLRKIVEILKSYKAIVHIDAMQAMRFFPIDVNELNVDMMTFAPHKFYGPKGIGALYLKKSTPIVRQNDGGQQEYYLRSGTENVAGIVGFGKTIEILKRDMPKYFLGTINIREYFEKKLSETFSEKIKFNSNISGGLPSISSIIFKNNQADQILIQLDMHNICVSAGSACNSGSIQLSPVLKAIGIPEEEAKCTVRFSFDHQNTKEEIDKTIEILKGIIK